MVQTQFRIRQLFFSLRRDIVLDSGALTPWIVMLCIQSVCGYAFCMVLRNLPLPFWMQHNLYVESAMFLVLPNLLFAGIIFACNRKYWRYMSPGFGIINQVISNVRFYQIYKVFPSGKQAARELQQDLVSGTLDILHSQAFWDYGGNRSCEQKIVALARFLDAHRYAVHFRFAEPCTFDENGWVHPKI